MKKVFLVLIAFSLLLLGCAEQTTQATPTPFPTTPSPAASAIPTPVPSVTVCTADVSECPDGSFVGRDSENNCAFKPCPVVEATPSPTPSTAVPNITEFKTQVEAIASDVLNTSVTLTRAWEDKDYFASVDFDSATSYKFTVEKSNVNAWPEGQLLSTFKGEETGVEKRYHKSFFKFTDSYTQFEGTLYCFNWKYKLYFQIRQPVDRTNFQLVGDETANAFLGKAIDICP